jgi:hypothetical protein
MREYFLPEMTRSFGIIDTSCADIRAGHDGSWFGSLVIWDLGDTVTSSGLHCCKESWMIMLGGCSNARKKTTLERAG